MKEAWDWYSGRVERQVRLVRWGHYGQPILLLPTAGGDAEEAERQGLIETVQPFIESGRIKVYSCDSVPGQAWLAGQAPAEHLCWLQNQYDEFIYREVVPAIRRDCQSEFIEIITAGASIGAFHAVALVCRHPDVFRLAIAMSGTYDLEQLFGFSATQDSSFGSPLLFLPNRGEGERLHRVRQRFVLLAHGQGRWESPEESWRIGGMLGARGVPNRVGPWGRGGITTGQRGE
jgi:esterase/lipase superfamily enzyme